MKRSFVFSTLSVVISLTGFTQKSLAADTFKKCFSRIYSQDHLNKHEGQRLRALELQIERFELDDNKGKLITDLKLSGVPATGGPRFQFAGSDSIGDNQVCASFQADGDEHSGCALFQFENVDKKGNPLEGSTLLLKPLPPKNYKSSGQKMKSVGITLIRCFGNSSDGEGCEQGALRIITLRADDPENRAYRLHPVDCPK